jgi:stearoyl-CoA desaturase (delta-9 desaturase)
MNKDRVLSPTAAAPRVQTGPSPLWQPPQKKASVTNWLKSLPFIGLHVACLAALLTGIDTTAVILCFVTYFIRMFGITGGYHRYFAHRSYKTSRLGQFFLAWLGCSALQKGPLWWASHHRQHHRHSDMPEDPHSPHVTSFWWSHVGWILSEEHIETPWDEIKDYARYPELRWLDQWHWIPGMVLAVVCYFIGAVIGGWDFSLATIFTQGAGWTALVWGFVVSTVLCYHATFSINSLTHLIGNRRYATTDESRNNLILAILTLGEGWHNNHHHYQSSANQGFFWWEIDISYYIIRSAAALGLTWDVRRPGYKALNYRNIEVIQSGVPVGDPSPGEKEQLSHS